MLKSRSRFSFNNKGIKKYCLYFFLYQNNSYFINIPRIIIKISNCLTSGAVYWGVPQNGVVVSPLVVTFSLHTPKSASLQCPSLSNNMFSNFKSL